MRRFQVLRRALFVAAGCRGGVAEASLVTLHFLEEVVDDAVADHHLRELQPSAASRTNERICTVVLFAELGERFSRDGAVSVWM